MLPGSLALYLLLLARRFPLTLLLLHLLADTFALGLLPKAGLHCTLLLDLLPPQILHLLPRVTIAARCLPGQIRHLSFPRLLCGYVRLLTRLRAIVSPLLACGPALICDLKFLVSRSIGHWLNS